MTTMEDLTKTQIVLLTLLVSFITSIATGIITTALLAEAPAGVTQTINRVVERTIEKVVPSATSTNQQQIREVTVVKEEDAILSSIDKVAQGVVRLNVRGGDGTQNFFALGAIVNKEGYIVSDGQALVLDGTYTAILADGSAIPAAVISRSVDQDLAIFKLMSGDTKRTYTPIVFASNPPRLGQSVIAIEGKTDLSVNVGRVTSIVTKADGPAGQKTVYDIATDISSRGEVQGGPLINLSGQLVGIKSSAADMSLVPGLYTALDQIKALLQNPPARP